MAMVDNNCNFVTVLGDINNEEYMVYFRSLDNKLHFYQYKNSKLIALFKEVSKIDSKKQALRQNKI